MGGSSSIVCLYKVGVTERTFLNGVGERDFQAIELNYSAALGHRGSTDILVMLPTYVCYNWT